MNSNHKIIEAALKARTQDDADEVQDLIVGAVGGRFERPIGDRWNNQGMLTASGASYDHKALEVVTNMQDAVLERLALQKYPNRGAVPFANPHEASTSLLADLTAKEQADLATVTIDDSGKGKKQVTLVMRDKGCGMTPASVPRTIFQIGTSHKNGIDWQQGTFGLGGATTYRNAKAAILVTRRHPDLLDADENDSITVAVVQWGREQTTTNAFYLVATPWEEIGDTASPFSAPASDFPQFEPGTHLALIEYATGGLARRSGDERSFDTVFNTRLYRPVLPINYRNLLVRPRTETLQGLEQRLDQNPADPGREGSDVLPFKHDGKTYHLPIRFRLFSKAGEAGARRNFVAHGHALIISSNGQVHSHWQPQEFKFRTKLNKLNDRILVMVESDDLPIEVRTEMFTADRTQLVSSAVALRLEQEIVAFLNEWPALRDANNELVREAITGDNSDRPTIEIARKIARAWKTKGFSTGGTGTGGGGPKPPDPTPLADLHDDPTRFDGPTEVEALIGNTKGVFFKLNATDDFFTSGRGKLVVTCDHPEIDDEDITVGDLRAGRIRVSIAVPDTDILGPCILEATIPEWAKSSGGLGPRFEWETKLVLVDETTPKPAGTGAGAKKGNRGPGAGDLVALIWTSDAKRDDWDSSTVGEVEEVTGTDLAAQRDEYKDLSAIGDAIPTIVLNSTYSPLKSYISARAAELTEEGKEQSRERYAVGAGVNLLLLDAQRKKDAKKGVATDEAAMKVAAQAGARGVLAVLPDYDRLAKELDD